MSGVLGVYSLDKRNVARDLFYGLAGLQHRGEEGCGVSLNLTRGFLTPPPDYQLVYYYYRDLREDLKRLGSNMAIGHTLYESSADPQPVKDVGETHSFTMAVDGFLLGFHDKNDFIMRTIFSKRLDDATEDGLKGPDAFFYAGERLMEKFSGRGSYCVVSLVENDDGQFLVVYRDPKGLKPLALGRMGDTHLIASESVGIEAIPEAEFVRDVEPGEMIVISDKYGFNNRVLREEPHAHCSFEWVYYAHIASVIEGTGVYEARKRLGAALARRYDLDDLDKVFASPDSGRGVSLGCQQEIVRIRMQNLLDRALRMDDTEAIKGLLQDELMGTFVPFEEGITKNPGAKRTFQVENERHRKLAARIKFSMVKDEVGGQVIGVGDDSIVKGTVFGEGTVLKAKQAGAEGVIGIISCPPLKYPCVKAPGKKEFIAQGLEGDVKDIGRQVAEKLGMKQVCYNSLDDLQEAIGLSDMCTACFDGNYPVNPELLEREMRKD